MLVPLIPRPAGLVLTAADISMLYGLAIGESDAQIGRRVEPAAPPTAGAVRTRVLKLRRRMGAESRAHMVLLAVQWRVLRPF
jgi:hypothetical protein